MTAQFSILLGRFLLGLYFFLPGVQKFTQQADMLAYMQSHGIGFSQPLLWFAGATSLIGGVMLMTGRHVKLVAYGFVIYVVLVNLTLHDFWTMTGDQAGRETQNFVKNLGILAGLLVLAGYAPTRRVSLQDFWRADKTVTHL